MRCSLFFRSAPRKRRRTRLSALVPGVRLHPPARLLAAARVRPPRLSCGGSQTPSGPSAPETPSEPEQPDAPSEPDQPSGSTSVLDYEQQVVTLVNAERAKYGLAALALDETLCGYARVKSQDMHDQGYFSHTSPTYGPRSI